MVFLRSILIRENFRSKYFSFERVVDGFHFSVESLLNQNISLKGHFSPRFLSTIYACRFVITKSQSCYPFLHQMNFISTFHLNFSFIQKILFEHNFPLRSILRGKIEIQLCYKQKNLSPVELALSSEPEAATFQTN